MSSPSRTPEALPAAGMEIDFLANHPGFIPTLARWHYDEWRHLRPGDSIEGRIERLRSACNRGQIPTVFVAFSGATLLGSAKLVADDLRERSDLSPWLAGVFVAPAHRGRGIGAALVQRVVEQARALKVRRLYLYTPTAASFYAKLGWCIQERLLQNGTEVTLMFLDLRA